MVEQRPMMEGRRMVMIIGPRGGVIRPPMAPRRAPPAAGAPPRSRVRPRRAAARRRRPPPRPPPSAPPPRAAVRAAPAAAPPRRAGSRTPPRRRRGRARRRGRRAAAPRRTGAAAPAAAAKPLPRADDRRSTGDALPRVGTGARRGKMPAVSRAPCVAPLLGCARGAGAAGCRRDGCVGGDDGAACRRRRARALRYTCDARAGSLRVARGRRTPATARRRGRRRSRRPATSCSRTISCAPCSTRPSTRRAWRPPAARIIDLAPTRRAGRRGRSAQRHLPGGGPAARATPSTTRAPRSSTSASRGARRARTWRSCSAATWRATAGSRSSRATSCARASPACACAPTSTTARADPNTLYVTDGFFWGDHTLLPFVPGRGPRLPRARSSICSTLADAWREWPFWRRGRRRRPTSSYAVVPVRSRARRAGFNITTLTAAGRAAAPRRCPATASRFERFILAAPGAGPGAGRRRGAARARACVHGEPRARDGHRARRRGRRADRRARRGARRRCCSTSRRPAPIPTTRARRTPLERGGARARRPLHGHAAAQPRLPRPAVRLRAARPAPPTSFAVGGDGRRTSATSRSRAPAHLGRHRRASRRARAATYAELVLIPVERPTPRDGPRRASTACSRAASRCWGRRTAARPRATARSRTDGQLRPAGPARALLRLRDARARSRRSIAPRSPSRAGDEVAVSLLVADRCRPAARRASLSGDFHVHGGASFDSSIPDQDRVVSFLAVGRRRRRRDRPRRRHQLRRDAGGAGRDRRRSSSCPASSRRRTSCGSTCRARTSRRRSATSTSGRSARTRWRRATARPGTSCASRAR